MEDSLLPHSSDSWLDKRFCIRLAAAGTAMVQRSATTRPPTLGVVQKPLSGTSSSQRTLVSFYVLNQNTMDVRTYVNAL